MTLKQFFQLAGGIVVGLIFYSTNLYPIIKWPIIIFCVALGAAMAFLPFEERPLEKWIIAFFRSIYSPTLYTWKKSNTPYKFYSDDKTSTPPLPQVPAGPAPSPSVTTKLENAESSFLSKLTSLWNVPQALKPAPVAQPVRPATPATPKPAVNIPQQIPTIITKSAPRLVVEEKTAPITGTGISSHDISISKNQTDKTPITQNVASFSVDAAPPHPATIPNTIVGQVVDDERKIIESAIMEIKDSTGRAVRALRSNKLGHFITVTPLVNGTYEISTEKEGYVFDPVSFAAEGNIIQPIFVKGKKGGTVPAS